MCTQSQNSNLKSRGPSVSLLVLAISILLTTSSYTFAQQFPLPGANNRPTSTEAQKPIEWMRGPVTATLTGNAEIRIPEGYAYLSADEGARLVLRRMNYPAQNSLIGILVPVTGGVNWVILLDYREVGYIK